MLYTLSAAMLTAPLFVPGMVRAAEPESEYEKEGGQDKEESKKAGVNGSLKMGF